MIKIVENFDFGFKYYLHYSDENTYLSGVSKTILITWTYEEKNIEITVNYGTLIKDFVTPDGKYLILIFFGNLDYPSPCNCVIYDREGGLFKVVCSPNLVGDWIKEFRKTDIISGSITGGGVKEIEGKKVVVLAVEDVQEYYKTGVHYYETRIFDPLTGEFGELIGWQLPLR